MKFVKYLIFLIIINILQTSQATVPVIWLRVSEPGNIAESKTHLGKVNYEYEILRTEVTNMMYADFLNSVARTDDPYRLYSSLMEEHFFGGITRKSTSTGFIYLCKDGYRDLPVVFVSWFDAVRYANWLHFGKPNYGRSVIGTTEGNDIVGAYDTRILKSPQLTGIKRNKMAVYWLPDRNEWLKAGFYGGKGKWWRFATQSDTVPTQATMGTSQAKNVANYYAGKWALPYPHMAAVGSSGPQSFYGTVDQAGNAAEWIESEAFNGQGWRLALGGSLFRSANSLEFGFYEGDAPEKKLSTFSFRVARQVGAMPAQFVGVESTVHAEIMKSKPTYSDYVLVDNPGNPPDIHYGSFGSVSYNYEISRYEISNREWVDFLNSVAVKSDPFGLYNQNQTNGVLGGINRLKHGDEWRYETKPGWSERPVNYIGWYDLARYANWQHYGRPATGQCVKGTTEGTAIDGAYDTTEFEAIRKGKKRPYKGFGRRNEAALYWIPDQNEWYKAAYYDPEKLGARPYWDYPTRSDNPPDTSKSGLEAMGANYQKEDHLGEGPPFYLAPVDSYRASASYFGTQQQAGNVWEWQEDWQYGQVGNRALRGGSFGYTEFGLHAMNIDPGGEDEESYVFGGRLARRAVGVIGFPEMTMQEKLNFYFRTMTPRAWLIASVLITLLGSLKLVMGYFYLKKFFSKCRTRNAQAV